MIRKKMKEKKKLILVFQRDFLKHEIKLKKQTAEWVNDELKMDLLHFRMQYVFLYKEYI